MTFRDIVEDNIMDFADTIPADFIGEIGREYCRGAVGEDDDSGDLKTVAFWELKNAEEDDIPTETEILWFYAGDPDDGAEILRSIENEDEYDDLARSYFELQNLDPGEKSAVVTSGYSVEDAESRDIYVTIEELYSIKQFRKAAPDYIRPLSELTSRQFKSAIMTSIFHGRYGIMEDLPFLPMTRFDPDISCCVMTDGKVNGLFLVHRMESGIFRVELLFALPPDADINLLNMLRYSVQAAREMRSPDEKVLLRRHNEATHRLVKKLFPDKKGAPVLKGEKYIL